MFFDAERVSVLGFSYVCPPASGQLRLASYTGDDGKPAPWKDMIFVVGDGDGREQMYMCMIFSYPEQMLLEIEPLHRSWLEQETDVIENF